MVTENLLMGIYGDGLTKIKQPENPSYTYKSQGGLVTEVQSIYQNSIYALIAQLVEASDC